MKTKNMVVIGMVAGCLMMVAGAGRAAAPDSGTVTVNGLVWLKDASCLGYMHWDQAMARAQSLRSGECGLTDGSKAGQWRLPTKDELSSIRSSKSQFSNVDPGYYWSGSASANSKLAWYVYMHSGYVGYDVKTTNSSVWAVRSVQ